ncbi:major facilitator transporter [Mycolicibacterium vaccae 95051]|nr:major facilitator transporter [Mycolicibacterium vaccae 95051]
MTAVQMGTASGRWVLLATVLGSGLVMVDGTVVNVALPHIGSDLGAGFGSLQWIVNAYTLTLASLILLGGALGDRFGRRRIFLIGVVWFALASLACGLAPNAEVLIAARALQGVGGALLTPGSLALISASFRADDRAAAIGAWSGLGGIAGAVGPFLGGILVEWSWRAVFLINLPLAVIVVAVTAARVPESRNWEASRGLDLAGAVLMVAGLGALTHGLTELGTGRADFGSVSSIAVGVLALTAFVVVERRSDHPLVSPKLFSDRNFRVANAMTLLIYGALGAVFLLLVLQLQIVAGFSPVAAGTALLPFTAVMLVFSSRAGALSSRIGPRLPMTVGPLIAAGGLLLMMRIGPDASWPFDVAPAAVVFGAGMVLVVAPLTATVLDSAPESMAGSASGVNNALARAGGLLAVAVLPGVAGISGGDYAAPEAFATGFRVALLISAALMVIAAVMAGVGIRRAPIGRTGRIPVENCTHCGLAGLPPHPATESC